MEEQPRGPAIRIGVRAQRQEHGWPPASAEVHAEPRSATSSVGTERRYGTMTVALQSSAQNGTYACGRRTGDHCCEAHDRSVAVRPGALATGSVVLSRSLSSRSRCSVLTSLQPNRGLRRRSSKPCRTGTRPNRKRGQHLSGASRLTPMWPHLCSVFSNVTSHVSVRAIGRH